MEKLIEAKVKDTDDHVFVIKGQPSRFVEGDEFVQVKRFPDDKNPRYIKKRSLVYHWK